MRLRGPSPLLRRRPSPPSDQGHLRVRGHRPDPVMNVDGRGHAARFQSMRQSFDRRATRASGMTLGQSGRTCRTESGERHPFKVIPDSTVSGQTKVGNGSGSCCSHYSNATLGEASSSRHDGRDARAQTDRARTHRLARSGAPWLAQRVIGGSRWVITERGTKHRHHVCRGA